MGNRIQRMVMSCAKLIICGAVAVAQSPAEQTPEEFENRLGMKLVKLVPGEFLMGAPESEEGYSEVELQHKVHITQPFYLGKHEVTVGQFRIFVEATGYQTSLERDQKPGFGFDAALGKIEILSKFNWRNTGFGDERHPVVNVSWSDAMAFCKWLSEREGREYRLPSEAQWEYACRGGTATRFFTGEEEVSLKPAANVADASFLAKYPNATWSVDWNDGHSFTAPVGSFQPNAFGLHDMCGNAWEWCADWYAADYYRESPREDPPGPKQGEIHVLRGGAFTNRNRFMRSADRDSTKPGYRYNFTGFRVMLPAK